MAPPGAPRVRPVGWWYLVPAAMAVLACVLGVAAVVRGFDDAEQTALDASTAAPGTEQVLTIPEPAGYTVAYFGPTIVRSTGDRDQLIEDLRITITPADGGPELPLRPYEGLNDLTAAGEQYVPLLTVRFEAGDYVLRSSRTSGVDPERAGVAVSQSPYRKLRSGAERGVVVTVVGLALALLVTVILARVRGRSKAAIRALLPPPAPWPAPVPHGAPPPGGWRGPGPGGWGGAPPGWPPR
ncbi:MAG TPA: hypothetical protein VFU19_03255 [Iamia sp.]|nr:hypothetical protein [Iamia sp.]